MAIEMLSSISLFCNLERVLIGYGKKSREISSFEDEAQATRKPSGKSSTVEFEQYPTGPHIASRMLYMAENSFDDVSGKIVADFGCGCGTLGLAAALLGAEYVSGIDIDSQSLEIASQNAEDLELDINLIQCDIRNLGWRGKIVDTVVMNPPFGTRKKGADMDFLFVALKVASQAVYSLHKTTTRDHVKRAALRDFNARNAEVLCELRFDVPQLYKFHKKKEVDIAVDLWRFVP
ncbi:hypothetical protein HHK36_021643 [Tetracentron sinense]|uniref:Methyltransferase-like protein 5 n=1 Tax=Tetracentron sinense TaxID=13715 RepID=A0A834YQ37_TETSI|nr:hypothetical protein HHK36_021643 [Tetracentron sinense]